MQNNNPVVLITGGARRIGAAIARTLHEAGMNVALHYRHSKKQGIELASELNKIRQNSAMTIHADLLDTSTLKPLILSVHDQWDRLDVLVNNASSFYPTPVNNIKEEDWHILMGSNLKAPLFLSQAAIPYLEKQQGCIINIIDIHAKQPLKGYTVYNIAKAGLLMMTRSLARELGPNIRVNGIAPGAILWPENDIDDKAKQDILRRTALKRKGEPIDIARAARYLVFDADYITGEIIHVDGGRSLGF